MTRPTPQKLRATLERDLAEAEADVLQGARHLEQQHKVISELERDGHDTLQAKELLVTFEKSMALHVEHRDRLRKELQEPGE